MESLPQDNMIERQESHPQNNLEAPYVKIIRDIVHTKIPDHKESFDITLDEINRQITGEGLFVFNSQKYSGVSFLAGHLSVTPDLIKRIASQKPQALEVQDPEIKPGVQKLEHYVYFVEPSFGIPPDGSALSALDMAIDRFIREMPKVAASIRKGQKAPTVDIYIVGGPLGLGGKVTQEFADKVMGTNGQRAEGFGPYGEIYAEFVQNFLAEHNYDLDKTRIVLQGASKGAITSDLTTHNLPKNLKARTQRLYDNPGGVHGRNIPSQIGRSVNLGLGMAAELGVRQFAGTVKNNAFVTQGEDYKEIAKAKNLPEDNDEQKQLKGDMFFRVGQFLRLGGGGEMRTLGHGTPLDEKQRTFVRISKIEPVNLSFRNIARVIQAGVSERVVDAKNNLLGKKHAPRRALVAKQNGRILTFATNNTFHNFPWERSIASGSWAQKMQFVENSRPPSAS